MFPIARIIKGLKGLLAGSLQVPAVLLCLGFSRVIRGAGAALVLEHVVEDPQALNVTPGISSTKAHPITHGLIVALEVNCQQAPKLLEGLVTLWKEGPPIFRISNTLWAILSKELPHIPSVMDELSRHSHPSIVPQGQEELWSAGISSQIQSLRTIHRRILPKLAQPLDAMPLVPRS